MSHRRGSSALRWATYLPQWCHWEMPQFIRFLCSVTTKPHVLFHSESWPWGYSNLCSCTKGTSVWTRMNYRLSIHFLRARESFHWLRVWWSGDLRGGLEMVLVVLCSGPHSCRHESEDWGTDVNSLLHPGVSPAPGLSLTNKTRPVTSQASPGTNSQMWWNIILTG